MSSATPFNRTTTKNSRCKHHQITLPYGMSCPSVVCDVVAPYARHRLELFGNIFASCKSLGTRVVCIKILGRKLNGFKVIVQVKWKATMKNCRFRPIFCFISKTVQDTAIVTMEDEYEVVCDLLNGATSNDLE